jgi:16S rRNA processing protein RimM
MSQEQFYIAQIGRTIGLWGDLKLNLHTDFPEQFKVGSTFKSDRGELSIADVNFKRGTIRFLGYESIDSAKKLTNAKIYTDLKQTQKNCTLEDGQYFYFDIEGCSVVQGDLVLGVVNDIQRMLDIDYLVIDTDKSLVDEGFSKSFLLPYIERYVLTTDTEEKKIYTKDAKDILEAS